MPDLAQSVFASWNIRSTKGKRHELMWFLKREQVDVLALQETFHKDDEWRLRLGNYQVLSSPMSKGTVGERGVALAISPSLIAHETGTRSPFWIWARILHPLFPQGIIVGSVYVIAHEGPERQAMLCGLRDAVRGIHRRHAGSPILIMGDWNMDGHKLDATLATWTVQLQRLSCRGSPRTRWRGTGTLRDLDHIVVTLDIQSQLANAWVNRSWDLSDHWPICTSLRNRPQPRTALEQNQQSMLRLNRGKVQAYATDITSHNMWQALAEDDCADAEAYVERLLETSSLVANSVGVTMKSNPREHHQKQTRQPLSRKCRRLIDARRKVFEKWEASPSKEEKGGYWDSYVELRKESRKLIREEQRADWARFLAKGAELMVSGESKRAWGWIKSLSQCSTAKSQVPQPVRDLEGKLQVEPEEIAKTWAEHYAALAQDTNHHSRDPAHWQEMGTPRQELSGLDEPISWRELNEAIRAIRAGKAPGLDGLPPEWFKTMAELPSEAGAEPLTPMAKAFFKAIQGIWQNASIPACWNRTILVSVPKKGDLTYMDNYRGISLIGIALKLLCKVIICRISRALENETLLVPEQAGFRSLEECMGQVVTLYEVCTRRSLKGLPTYAAFIDFRKAYDMVPHEALMRKLWCIGVRGRTLAFIKSLYHKSEVSVRVGSTMSEPFLLNKGLRQGCPMSPILFDIFINDILKEQEELGIEIPGVNNRKLPGLMFADDVVVLAPDRLKLKRLLHRVETWANQWEMSIGALKCGVTVFNGDIDSLRADQWTLQGQSVPVVETYTYLGIEVHNDWDLTKTAANISSRARKALWALRPALGNSMIPLVVKGLMIKSLVIPVAAFGGEILGMQKERAKGVQSVIDRGLKWISSGDGSRGTVVSASAIRAELGIASMHAIICGRRTRAWVKFRNLKTWISTLISQPFSSRKSTWVTGTSRWLKRAGVNQIIEGKHSKAAARSVVNLVEESELERKRTSGLDFYVKWGFKHTKSFIKLALQRPNLAKGVRWLTRMRTLGFWTGPRAAKAKQVLSWCSRVCPSCGMTCKEDIPHILLECQTHSDIRHRLIQPVVERVAGTNPAYARVELATALLGGQVSGVGISQQWLGATTQSKLENDAPFLRVAEYLQEVMPKRMRRLWEARIPRLADGEWCVVLPKDFPLPTHRVEVIIDPVPGQRSRSPKGYGSSTRAEAG
jgi:exonuclease III